MAKIHLSWFLPSAFVFLLIGLGNAEEHIVGGNTGWVIPSSKSFYQEWAQSRKFVMGDTLVFNFKTSVHSVLEVPKQDFDACTQLSVIEMHQRGPTIIHLDKPGDRYFYCGIGLHCEAGQKLSVTVHPASQ